MECSQGSQSVLARLMGLDTLPPQQHVNKRKRVLSEKYLQRTASIGVREKRLSHEGRSFRMNVEDQQEFRDVFEVSEALTMDKDYNLLALKKKSRLLSTEAEIEFLRPKCMDAECLLLNEKLQNSEDFYDKLKMQDSNQNLFLKYLQEPDTSFTKHLHDLQGVPSHPELGHITVLKPIYSPNCRNNGIGTKVEKKTNKRNVLKSHQKLGNDLITHSRGGFDVDFSDKLLKLHSEPESDTCLSPTRIVVLKPLIGKACNPASFIYSSCQGPESANKDNPSSENGEVFIEVGRRKNLYNDMETVRHRSRVSREIAKEITRNMTHRMNGSSTEVWRLGFRGDDTSATESEIGYQTSFSSARGSLLDREAKKHLTERWNLTNGFQKVGLASRSSTLGDILALPYLKTGPSSLTYKLGGKHGLQDRFGPNNEDAHLGNPLGISSGDDWKDKSIRRFPRSKSVPASLTVTRNLKSWTTHQSLHNDWYLKAMDAVRREKNKSMSSCKKPASFPYLDSGNCAPLDDLKKTHNENDLNEENSMVSKSSVSTVPCSSENSYAIQESWMIQDELKEHFEKDLSGRGLMVLNSSTSGVASLSMVTDREAGAKTEDAGMFSGTHMEQESKSTAPILSVKDGSSSHVLDASIRQETLIGSPEEGPVPLLCPRLDPHSPARSEEACQPSPVSVLELLSKEEILAGTECFESVSANSSGSWMQHQLLKIESPEEYSEGSGMYVSSDEDTTEVSVNLVEENGDKVNIFKAKQSRDFSYLADVLIQAGFYGGNLEIYFKIMQSPDFPINLTVFEALEKKYCQETSWGRSERRLLFDRINSGLMEILLRCMNMHMWAKSMAKRCRPWWSWKVIEEELWMLLVSKEKEVSKDPSEKVLDMRWLELGDDINVIGVEIERMLIDELVTEFVGMENFE